MSTNKLKLKADNLNFCVFVDSTFSHFHIIQAYYQYLEKLINSQGGIGYKKIFIHLQDQVELQENKQTIYEFITNNDFQFVLLSLLVKHPTFVTLSNVLGLHLCYRSVLYHLHSV